MWLKIDTGMHRLGIAPACCAEFIEALKKCSWISDIGIMTHLACADEPENQSNLYQLEQFKHVTSEYNFKKSIANSAAILSLPQAHADVVRPGIMLYGVSPFAHQTGLELGLKPVMHLLSSITEIHQYDKGASIGYGKTWICPRKSRIAIIPVGYGDGYPRHIEKNTPVYVNGHFATIVGRISMDMMTIDITDFPDIQIGDPVELWGKHIAVEKIAQYAHTIAYELICQITKRGRGYG